ncbi:MAG: TIGR04282 family arsenosugar biosynthesis glycosyltransferase [Candidatus Lokiarchaeota archaeon]|jgi:rSAM/selenodomain-associated transferase 1
MEKRAVIILIRNPVLGCVKTRLAADIGDHNALKIYISLLNYTRNITTCTNSSRLLFYSDFINFSDEWDNQTYEKHLQSGKDFGEKMLNAFKVALAQHQLAVIIGSDCFELTSELITLAFQKLESFDAVLGPAKDGGYYLLGLQKVYPQLFKNKRWSSSSVLSDTINTLKDLNLTYYLLPTLTDIDTIHDLKGSELYSQLDHKSSMA